MENNLQGDMRSRITEKLARGLQPILLEVVNESALHKGHAGDDGSGETHFHVKVVSSVFEGVGRIERQRMVFALISEEMASGIHALSISAIPASEYGRM